MSNIDLRITADDSQLIARLSEIENRLGRLDKIAAQHGKTQHAAFSQGATAADRMNKSIGSSGSAFAQLGGVVAGLGLVAGITAIGKEIFDVTAQMETLQTSFTNAFSKEGVNAASVAAGYMQEIKDIAKTTPFEFDALAESVLKLTNQGFEPTRQEIIQLGDLASTTGKDFSQLAEAVIDAQVGEFERLKEFGIRATKANGEVTLSFKGQTTVVKDNEEAIRNAIVAMGKLEGVQGAMAAQALTLKGQLSNVSDSLSQLGAEIGSRLAPEIAVGIQGFSDFVNALDVDKIFAFFKPISENLLPALKHLYAALLDTGKALTGSATDGEFFQKIMNGLSFAFELVVDAVSLIIDSISNFVISIRDAYIEGGIFTAVIDSIGVAISGLASGLKYVIDGLQKLYLGEDEYNKRAKDAIDADEKRTKAAIERKKQDAENVKNLEEHRKHQEKHTKSTVENKDAQKEATKALKDYEDTLKSVSKVTEDFNKKSQKLKAEGLEGFAKINADKSLEKAEVKQVFDAEDAKLAAYEAKAKVGSKRQEEIKKQRLLLSESYALLDNQLDIKYHNQSLDLQEKFEKEAEDILKKSIEDKAKLLSDAEKEKVADTQGTVAFITQQKELSVADIDIAIGTLEAKKELNAEEINELSRLNKEKLQVQIDYLTQERAVIAAAYGENAPETQLLDNQIQQLHIGLAKLGNDKKSLDLIAQFKERIKGALGINDETLNTIIDGVSQGIGAINQLISDNTKAQIEENNALIDSLKSRVSETESALKTEEELKAKGLANNADTKRAELEDLKAQEKKAFEENKKLRKDQLKQQLASDLLQQASSLAVAAAKNFAANAGIPFGIGIAISLIQIAAMYASFRRFQAQAKAISGEQLAFKGGALQDYLGSGFVKRGGSNDAPGAGGRGYKIQGTNLRVGGDEFLVNANSATRHAPFLEKLNAGNFDSINLLDTFQKYPSLDLKVITRGIDKNQELLIKSQHRREEATLERIHNNNTQRIIDTLNNQEKIIQLADGYMIIKGGNKEIVRYAK